MSTPHAKGNTFPATPVTRGRVSSATTLWLIRHAEVEERYQGVFGGQIDMDLSLRGQQQAAALAEFLHGFKFDALYASPMRRVQQTLAPWLANSAPRPILRPELKEVDFGDWTGLNWDQLLSRFGVNVSTWLDQIESGSVPNGESSAALRARLEPCLHEILKRHPGQHVAVACHGGVIRMLLTILLGWPLPRWASVEIDYASVTRIRCNPNEAKLQLLNFIPWDTVHAARTREVQAKGVPRP
jgi:broad specificity phosphatase PhoE